MIGIEILHRRVRQEWDARTLYVSFLFCLFYWEERVGTNDSGQ